MIDIETNKTMGFWPNIIKKYSTDFDKKTLQERDEKLNSLTSSKYIPKDFRKHIKEDKKWDSILIINNNAKLDDMNFVLARFVNIVGGRIPYIDSKDKRITGSYFESEDIFSRLNSFQTVNETNDFIKDNDIVVLNNLGTESYKPEFEKILCSLIQSRINFNKTIIITTKLSPSQIKEKYSNDVFEQIKEYFKIVIVGEGFKKEGDDGFITLEDAEKQRKNEELLKECNFKTLETLEEEDILGKQLKDILDLLNMENNKQNQIKVNKYIDENFGFTYKKKLVRVFVKE